MNKSFFIFALLLLFINLACGSSSSNGANDNDVMDGGETTAVTSCDAREVIPLNYTLESDHIAIQAEGGTLKTSIGAFGGHILPHTGHIGGKKGSDWHGLYGFTYDEVTYLSGGDGSAPCNEGDVCGVLASDVLARTPDYIAPVDGTALYSLIYYSEENDGMYHNSTRGWSVGLKPCGDSDTYDRVISVGHIASISNELQEKLVAAGYQDPDTADLALNTEIITGDPVILNRGDKIGPPQVQAYAVEGYENYLTGPDPLPSPYAQIEFTVYSAEIGDAAPIPTFYSDEIEEQFEQILLAEANREDSLRYSFSYLEPWQWLWKAEMHLYPPNYMGADEITSLFSWRYLGTWFEYNGATCPANNEMCNNAFTICPINKSSNIYDASLYNSSDVSYFTITHTYGTTAENKFGEVISPSTLDNTSGSMTIMWRISGTVNLEPAEYVYQGMSYYLNTETDILKISWADTVTSQGEVVYPVIPDDTAACNGTSIICYTYDDHARAGIYNDI